MDNMKAAGVPIPEIAVKRTGQFETLVGAKCEVVTFDWKMALPIPEAARASLPPDFPSTIAMNGDSVRDDRSSTSNTRMSSTKARTQ